MYTRTLARSHAHRIFDSYLYMDLSEYDNNCEWSLYYSVGPVCVFESKWIFRPIEYDENRIGSDRIKNFSVLRWRFCGVDIRIICVHEMKQ